MQVKSVFQNSCIEIDLEFIYKKNIYKEKVN